MMLFDDRKALEEGGSDSDNDDNEEGDEGNNNEQEPFQDELEEAGPTTTNDSQATSNPLTSSVEFTNVKISNSASNRVDGNDTRVIFVYNMHSKVVCLVFSKKYGRFKSASRDHGKSDRQSCFFSTPYGVSYRITSKFIHKKSCFLKTTPTQTSSIFWQKFSTVIKKCRS